MVDWVEGRELPYIVEGVAGLMSELADQAQVDGARAVELTARDASEALLALLDALQGPARNELNAARRIVGRGVMRRAARD